MKLQVHGPIGKADFSVPKEFEEYSKALYDKGAIGEREFVDFCLLALTLIDDHWSQRQGLAYHLSGALQYPNIQKDELLDEIGCEFGELELPDDHAAGTEEQVRQKWQHVKQLVQKADKKFSKKVS